MMYRMSNQTTVTTARLETRLPVDVHALLKRAAEIEGRTLTDSYSDLQSSVCRPAIVAFFGPD